MATFGLSDILDIFKEKLKAVIKVVPGVMGIADDVLAKGGSETNHDIVVLSLLETVQNNNLKFNPDRDQFKKRECKFFWTASHPRWHEHRPKDSQCH